MLNNIRNGIRIVSDIHLERQGQYNVLKKFMTGSIERPKYLALLGDIGDPSKQEYRNFLYEQSDNYEQVFVLSGNHEYYFKIFQDTNELIHNICDKRSNLNFLNNDKFKIDDGEKSVNIIGSTLWSNLRISKEKLQDLLKIGGDFRHIKFDHSNNSNMKKMFVVPMNQIIMTTLHMQNVSFIEKNIIPSKTNIVLTHHAPSFECLKGDDGKFIYSNGDQVKEMFASELEWLFPKGIDYWCFGHTHRSVNKMMDNTRLICNPMGFRPTKTNFDIDCIIDLD